MKYLKYYQDKGITKSEVFNYFINNLKPSVKVWDYFIKWEKVNKNVDGLKIELNLLNSLLDSSNLEDDFINLIIKYPNVIKTLPVLLAIRENKIEILKDYKNHDLNYLTFDFNWKEKVSNQEAKNYFFFLKQSGLIELFKNKKIKNFIDYVFGVEVGLDSNGRKNRGGKLMEEIVNVFIKKMIGGKENLEYLPQATPTKIKEKWNFKVKFDKSARSFDFAIFNKVTKKLFLIETNFYNGGGTKLKSVCGEFKGLCNELGKQDIKFIWVTDGYGWISAKRPLEETFKNNDYVFNLHIFQDGVLNELIKN
jgi:hypothetical protein